MVSCRQCATTNSLDSTYCRKCGDALSETDIDAGRAKVAQLLEDGSSAYNVGRIDEAFEISETALASDPINVTALALKMNCLERRDRISDALECAERIVELNPDSELDKIKRNQLRRNLEFAAREPMTPNRRVAWISGISTIILVMALGSYAGIMVKRKNDSTTNASPKLEASLEKNSPITSVAQVNQTTPTNPTTSGQPNPGGHVIQDAAAATPDLTRPPLRNDEMLPSTGPGYTIKPIEPGPIGTGSSTPPTKNTETARTNTGGTGNGTSPEPDPDIKIDSSGTGRSDTKPVGSMDIQVRGAGSSSPPIADAPDGNDLKAIQKTATQLFSAQRFEPASKNYEKAISIGGDSSALYERLGQCYEHMGRKSAALSAYEKGLQACQQALASGKGDKDRLSTKADMYKSHIKALGG